MYAPAPKLLHSSYRASMKKLSLLFAWTLLTSVASAAPYLVYSGMISGANYSFSKTTNAATKIFILTDLSNSANFAVMLVDTTGHYSTLSRPSDSPTTEEANNNFFASTGTEAIVCYSDEVTNSSNVTTVIRGYGTGVLGTRTIQLAAARPKPLVVELRTNRVPQGSYTFSNTGPSITSGILPYAKAIAGTASGYVISAGGDLTTATSPGTVSLGLNLDLTGLANIGGAYAPNISNVSAVLPVTIPNGTSISDAFAAWLAAFAQANGYTAASSISDDAETAAEAFSGGTSIGGSTLALNGTLDANGASTVKLGAGTLVLSGANTYAGAVTVGSSNVFSGVLTIGGLVVGTATSTISTGTLTINDPNDSGATLILNVSPGTLSIGGSGTGSLTLSGSGSLFPNPGSTQTFSGTLSLTSGSVLVTAVNGDGTVNGTIGSTGTTTLGPYTFTEATLTANGATTGFQVSATYTGQASITGGTVTNTSGTITFANSTITVTPPTP